MNKKGTVALEAIIASCLALMLLTVIASLFLIFWQTWHETTQSNRQRQWSAMAYEYLCRDINEAQQISITASEIRVILPEGEYVYRVSTEKSFYRGTRHLYFALAMVDSANWWWEGELLWIELIYTNESYRACFYIPEDMR